MLYFSGLQRENKSKINLAGIWFANHLALFGVAIGGSFSFLPTSFDRQTTMRANPAPQAPQACPASPVREPCPATLAKLAGLRVSKLTDCIGSAGIAKQTRINSTIGHNQYCANGVYTRVTRLKRRTPHASRQAGGRGCA